MRCEFVGECANPKTSCRVVEDADPYDVMRRKISQRAAEGVGPYKSLAEFARQGK